MLVLESWGRGGTEAYVSALTRWMSARGTVKLTICLLHQVTERRELDDLGIPSERVYVLEGGSRFVASLGLYRLLKRECPDIVHLHVYSSLFLCVAVARLAGHRQIVTTLHMPIWQWHWRHRVAWRLAIRWSHVVTGVSSAVITSISDVRGNVLHTSPPIPRDIIEEFEVDRGMGRRSQGVFVIAGAGRLSAEKNWKLLLQAIAALNKDQDDRCMLRLFGEGPERAELVAMAERLGIQDDIRLEGHKQQWELLRELQRCDVFVLPSNFEGLGMVAIEAMALGVPTIAADFEASADYIEHGVTGHRFPRGDVHALVEQLRWQRVHPDETKAIGKKGQTLVRTQFTADVVFSPLLAVYKLN